MSEQISVADYIVRRFAREGITDCFGVPGDYAFELPRESASYIEVVGGRMDLPAKLVMAHQHLDAMYAND